MRSIARRLSINVRCAEQDTAVADLFSAVISVQLAKGSVRVWFDISEGSSQTNANAKEVLCNVLAKNEEIINRYKNKPEEIKVKEKRKTLNRQILLFC